MRDPTDREKLTALRANIARQAVKSGFSKDIPGGYETIQGQVFVAPVTQERGWGTLLALLFGTLPEPSLNVIHPADLDKRR